MPVHDLRCIECGSISPNVVVSNSQPYPACRNCGGETTWMPFVVNTDCYGSTKTSEVLYEDIGKPATYSSRRELESKMKRIGFEPCGDTVGGARNNDGYRGTSFSIAGKTSRATPRTTRSGREA